jgi:hypothetical protein
MAKSRVIINMLISVNVTDHCDCAYARDDPFPDAPAVWHAYGQFPSTYAAEGNLWS